MPTVLWETLRCSITLQCVVRLGLITSWPSVSIWFGNTSSKKSSQKCLIWICTPCKKTAPFHFIQATPRLVLSALIGNFSNKVACFSCIVSHPIAKSHVKPWSVREYDATLVRLFLPFVFEQLRYNRYKTPAKNLNNFISGAMVFSASFWLRLRAPQPWSPWPELRLQEAILYFFPWKKS